MTLSQNADLLVLAELSRIEAELDELEKSLDSRPDVLRQLVTLMAEDDHVGLSFLLAAGIMLSASAFFFLQVFLVPRRWANSMTVCGLVTVVAWHHYMYMKDVWADTKAAPTVYRYMDWLITVPLQVVEFFLILSASNPIGRDPVPKNLCFRLLCSSMLMLVFGYMGETKIMERWVAFTSGLIMWIYIVWEVYLGEASNTSDRLALAEVKKQVSNLRHKKDDGVEPEDDYGNIHGISGDTKQSQVL